MAKIDTAAHKPSDVPACDWHAWILMEDGNYMALQFANRGIDKAKADRIVQAIAAACDLVDNGSAIFQAAKHIAEVTAAIPKDQRREVELALATIIKLTQAAPEKPDAPPA